jgi:predicted mannosyl-3-phosphoglycerate phosphatase (HAD superfamily)
MLSIVNGNITGPSKIKIQTQHEIVYTVIVCTSQVIIEPVTLVIYPGIKTLLAEKDSLITTMQSNIWFDIKLKSNIKTITWIDVRENRVQGFGYPGIFFKIIGTSQGPYWIYFELSP